MKPAVDRLIEGASRDQLVDALLSACQELAETHQGDSMLMPDGRYIPAGYLGNQVIRHLKFPDTIWED